MLSQRKRPHPAILFAILWAAVVYRARKWEVLVQDIGQVQELEQVQGWQDAHYRFPDRQPPHTVSCQTAPQSGARTRSIHPAALPSIGQHRIRDCCCPVMFSPYHLWPHYTVLGIWLQTAPTVVFVLWFCMSFHFDHHLLCNPAS